MELETIEHLASDELLSIERRALEGLKTCPVSESFTSKDAPNFSKLLQMHGDCEINTERWQEFCKRIGRRFDEQYNA